MISMAQRDDQTLKQDIVFSATLRGRAFTFSSTWGLFSPTTIDTGTRLLLELVEVRPEDTVVDIGCGYGPIGIPIAAEASRGMTYVVDSNYMAVEYARKNAANNGVANVVAMLSHGFRDVPPSLQFDLVVSNLPANVGRELLTIILGDAKERMGGGGRIVMVTIAGLREFIKRNFIEIFGNYEKVRQRNGYTVAMAVKS
ncbi:methyltransferase [Candidatus Uhrbacteria bacterium]|nr:methyltransferase [Candidatus Uhrbacteria bacterium]